MMVFEDRRDECEMIYGFTFRKSGERSIAVINLRTPLGCSSQLVLTDRENAERVRGCLVQGKPLPESSFKD